MRRLFILFVALSNIALAQTQKDYFKNRLWYNNPANTWNQALPIGNGTLGAMVFGNPFEERIQLNESSVWAGNGDDFVNPKAKAALPKVRELLFQKKYIEAQNLADSDIMGQKLVKSTYQTLGDLHLSLKTGPDEAFNYQRSLNLDSAISTVKYKQLKITYNREVFASAPAKVIIVHLTADVAKSISFNLSLTRPGDLAKIEVNGNRINLYEHVNNGIGVKLYASIRVLNTGGTLTVDPSGKILTLKKANEATIFISAATDFSSKDPLNDIQTRLDLATKKDYETLKKEHVADYQKYFNRVTLDLGANMSQNFPTDARLAAFRNGNTDPSLMALYYQFGRYLLISSSRPGGLPANLQGIWGDGLLQPWTGDYHININAQMNYWPAEITNLSEMQMPFIDYINKLVPDGKKTARDMYGLNGAVAHFGSDIFYYTETRGKLFWAMWPMGLAWCTQHIWEHYLFTGDNTYLANEGYNTLKEAAVFFDELLVKDPNTGLLVSGPSVSPENSFKTPDGKNATMVMGPTMDHMIIRELFKNTIAAAKLLNKDAALVKKLQYSLSQLSPTKIASDGRIMEWPEEFKEVEPGHRHISHLFGLYPGKEITSETPDLFAAAKKTLDFRLANGGGSTGWSRAWIINFFARLKQPEKAYENLEALLKISTLDNLLDNHPPFQIDGNFGGIAGMTEMLLQSHTGEVVLLPALPKEWTNGTINGIMARGGFEVNMNWTGGKLETVQIKSVLGNKLVLHYGNEKLVIDTQKGGIYKFNQFLKTI
jgi:alpha-L-fucosidase 2